ncbi:methyltransferase domain-containing protein [Neoroseomonas soli]|uniref:methyltransferase domain-containing protein n=1 Tax=Neoroseomonas soli TaxID=1081025 RepID=UPI001BA45134|nr:methyltransferase domain-containing protein [Neoroseomonas soli]
MDFRSYIRNAVGTSQRGIEIGASYSPILPKAEGYRTRIIDHTDADGLRRKYSAMGVDVSRVEEVDAIDDGGEFGELDDSGEGFDFIVASHVFEHLPDPIHFLQRCERALKPDGRLFLLVPDRRFCFDYLRPTSTAGQMLNSYLAKQRTHTPAALFDHHAYNALRDGVHVWAESEGGTFAFGGTARAGYDIAARRQEEYLDAHAWVFTPSTFRLIAEDLRSLGLIGMGEQFFHPSIGCEFLAVLSPAQAQVGLDRTALALGAVAEARGTVPASAAPATPAVDFGDETYVKSAPCAQHAIDTLSDSWVGSFPAALGVQAGQVALHDDARITWLVGLLGGSLRDMEVLELGPLEASHTAMLLDAGARSVLAIEANRRAYLRCLVTKEIRGLRDASFLLGNFVPYLETEPRSWPLIVASGVLYHMTDPLRLLELLSARTDRLFLWTHVVDAKAMPPGDPRRAAIQGREARAWRDMDVTLHRRPYGRVTDPAFCGGTDEDPLWMERDDLLGVLRRLGFDSIDIAHETPDHPAGPALSILARRTPR